MPRLLSVQVIADAEGWTIRQSSRSYHGVRQATEAAGVAAAVRELAAWLRLPRVPQPTGPTAAARKGRRQLIIWQVTGDRWHAAVLGERAEPVLIECMTGPFLVWRDGALVGTATSESEAIGAALVALLERAGLPAHRGQA